MKPKVSVHLGEEEYTTTHLCLDPLSPSLLSPVLIKPNLLNHANYPKGSITEIETIRAVVEYLTEHDIDCFIGEAGFSKRLTTMAFEAIGLNKFCSERGIELYNFFDSDPVDLETESFTVKVAEPVLQAKQIFSLSKMKCHTIHGVTLSSKNLMGCIVGQRRVYFHSGKALASLIKAFTDKCDVIGIIDGIVGASYCENAGVPVNSGVVLAGENIIALDLVALELMGFQKEDIPVYKYLEVPEYDLVGDKPPSFEFIKPIGWKS